MDKDYAVFPYKADKPTKEGRKNLFMYVTNHRGEKYHLSSVKH